MEKNREISGASFWTLEKRSWFGNIVGDLWGGAVTTFAVLPETIGFMIAAGVPPYIGLYTCIILMITLAIFGGRPGVMSAGAGSTAMITVTLVARYFDTYPEYLFAAVILAGLIQVVLGLCRVGNLVKYLPKSVLSGFCNGLAILIFISQVKLIFKDLTTLPEMLILVAVGVVLIVFLPRLMNKSAFLKKVPASLIAIILITVYAIAFGRPVMRISDMGSIVPSFEYVGMVFGRLPNIFTAECIKNILPVAFSVAMVGIIETMLTCRVVTEETNTPEMENLNRECCGQGIGNIICGIFGAMPGCAMMGQTNANIGAGGRGRLSSLFSGVLLAALLFSVSGVLAAIPLAALVAVMIIVCYQTFDWDSVIKFYRLPVKDTTSMLICVVLVLATDNLAYGVGAGIIIYVIGHWIGKLIKKSSLIFGIACLFMAGTVFAAVRSISSHGPDHVWMPLLCFTLAMVSITIAGASGNETTEAGGIRVASTVVMAVCGIAAAASLVFMYI